MTQLDQRIIDSCKQSWEEEFIPGTQNKNNCSGFVKSVTKKLGVPLPDANADGIVDALGKSWKKLASGAEAAQQATAGTFVVAGLKAAKHTPPRNNGHVVIVVSGKLYKDKYPLCWGGSLGSAQSRGEKSTGEVWNRTDRDNVVYYAYTKPVGKA
jgi:hypothetical protein